jgi:prepilin-type N-terminal cleavage/methylation domain-containing protein
VAARYSTQPGCGQPHATRAGARASGFTLIELLIVVIILAVLASVAVPHFRGESNEAKQSALSHDLAIINKAIELYRLQHDGNCPGTLDGKAKWKTLVTHLTEQTDRSGEPGTECGPYLRTGFPDNPFTGSNAGVIDDHKKVIEGASWIYDPDLGVVTAGVDIDSGPVLDPEPEPIEH